MSMIKENKKPILLVVNDNSLYHFLKKPLDEFGYELDFVTSPVDVKRVIENKRYFFFIIDYNLRGESPDSPGGIQLWKHIREITSYLNPDEQRSSVLITSDKDQMIYNDHYDPGGADRLLILDDLDKFPQKIDKSFKALTPYNWEIEIEDNLDCDLLSNTFSELQESSMIHVCFIVELLIRKLFNDASDLQMLKVSLFRSQGYSQASILHAVPFYVDKRVSHPDHLIKIESSSSCSIEDENYKKYVHDAAFMNKTTLLRRAYMPPLLGALDYEIKSGSDTLLNYYKTFEADNNLIAKLLDNMLDELDDNWYCNASVNQGFFIKEIFNGLSEDRDNIKNIFKHAFPELEAQITNDFIDINVEDIYIKIHNPLNIFPLKDSKLTYCPYSVIHGDLHFGNIMVQSKNYSPFIIDFYSLKESAPLYVDFAKLEEHLIIDLLSFNGLNSKLVNKLLSSLPEILINSDIKEVSLSDLKEYENISTISRALLIIKTIRSKAYDISERIYGRNKDKYSFNQCFPVHYQLSLLREFIISWNWVRGFPFYKKILNLSIISRIIEITLHSKSNSVINSPIK